VRGATFSLDDVTGMYTISSGTFTFAKRETAPVYFPDPPPPLNSGEWFSANAGVDLDKERVIIDVHVDTDGSLVTNLDTGDSFVEHINFFGVFSNPDDPHTLVVSISPSLNIPAGSTPPDEFGSTFEWEAAPVHSPPSTGTGTDVEDAPNEGVVSRFVLAPNYPNPFHRTTTISFMLPEVTPVRLEVYDLLGHRVEMLVDEVRPAGRYVVTWRASSVPGGVYFYRLQAGGYRDVKAMTVIGGDP